MFIKNVNLVNFRNYDKLSLEFNKNVNLILGKNAQGKTNLLESIYVSSIGKSFRTNNNSEMIKFDCDFLRVFVENEKSDYEGSVEIIINKDGKKYAKVDGVKINKSSELLKNIYIVIFSPEDLKIVKDEPEKRRKFIDRELSQIKPSYYNNLSNYKKILLQRNTYLKEQNIDENVLDIWNIELSKYGANIMSQRNEFIKKINVISSDIHKKITNERENLSITYSPNIPFEEDTKVLQNKFYDLLKKSQSNDLRLRTTTKGPHKDDIEFYINDTNVRSYGSQGQQRTTALSLKLAELNIIKEETGEEAILLLDDVMSELDLERQEFLVKSLSNIQLFVTTTEIPEKLLEEFPEGNIYRVDKGTVTSEKYKHNI